MKKMILFVVLAGCWREPAGDLGGKCFADGTCSHGLRCAETEFSHRCFLNDVVHRRSSDAPCADKSILLATTSGSPSVATCPDPRHRMEVQVATTPSNEEVGALVLCRCERDGGSP